MVSITPQFEVDLPLTPTVIAPALLSSIVTDSTVLKYSTLSTAVAFPPALVSIIEIPRTSVPTIVNVRDESFPALVRTIL